MSAVISAMTTPASSTVLELQQYYPALISSPTRTHLVVPSPLRLGCSSPIHSRPRFNTKALSGK
ncbi:hypothetical protein JZ751_005903 [Albula glossodonta]|uniref:Uncharacterized protein n=1 Tax=Albula glossodonta TaxID=121402 RepID=A0A8T2P5M2_9TELE|nr:hypothetical protein JZ751_005903 [Albula glossodonta]